MEEWRTIPFAPTYSVSSKGRVRRDDTGRIIKPSLAGRGYPSWIAYAEPSAKRFYVHRAVAYAFLGPPPNFKDAARAEVNHKNGDKEDNRRSNIEWLSSRDNKTHAYDIGLRKHGENHPDSKLSDEDVRTIRELRGRVPQKVLAKRFGVSRPLISEVQIGRARFRVT